MIYLVKRIIRCGDQYGQLYCLRWQSKAVQNTCQYTVAKEMTMAARNSRTNALPMAMFSCWLKRRLYVSTA